MESDKELMVEIDKISRRQSASMLGISLPWLVKLISFLRKHCEYSFAFMPYQKGLTICQHRMLEKLVELYRPGEGVGMRKQEIVKYLQTNPLIGEEE